MLLEAEQLGCGITKGTTAVISAQHSTLYTKIAETFSAQTARLYLEANLRAVKAYEDLAVGIDCDFVKCPSILYSAGGGALLEREVAFVRSLGFPASFTREVPVNIKVSGAEVFPDMAQFHPLKLLYTLAKTLCVYEHSPVEKLNGTTAFVNGHTVRAKKVIIATHYPFVNRHGLYFIKLYQRRSYVCAAEEIPELGCTLSDLEPEGMFFRSYGKLLIAGAGGSRTGTCFRGYEPVRRFIHENYPKARIRYEWANQDCVTLDGIPYIGPYSRLWKNVYTATGFGAWGMTTSMITAELLTDMVLERENKLAEVFDPSRTVFRKQLAVNACEVAKDLLTPSRKRCSHMGCALKWNYREHTWDCPCHGSRFTSTGELLDTPAQKSAKVRDTET